MVISDDSCGIFVPELQTDWENINFVIGPELGEILYLLSAYDRFMLDMYHTAV